jgi:hypothetical protein
MIYNARLCRPVHMPSLISVVTSSIIMRGMIPILAYCSERHIQLQLRVKISHSTSMFISKGTLVLLPLLCVFRGPGKNERRTITSPQGSPRLHGATVYRNTDVCGEVKWRKVYNLTIRSESEGVRDCAH